MTFRGIPWNKEPADVRFWRRVEKTDACWNWTGPLTSGYGRLHTPARSSYLAHRFAYEMLVGPIPAGLHLDHLCNNRACVNPAHLEPVTNEENSHRAAARRTHCGNGHLLAGNVYVYGGRRQCKTCHHIKVVAWNREARQRARAARLVAA